MFIESLEASRNADEPYVRRFQDKPLPLEGSKCIWVGFRYSASTPSTASVLSVFLFLASGAFSGSALWGGRIAFVSLLFCLLEMSNVILVKSPRGAAKDSPVPLVICE